MERRAMNFFRRAAIFSAAGLFLLLVKFPAYAQQQPVLPPFIKDLVAVGVPVTQGQPPANSGTVSQNAAGPQNSAGGNQADPNGVFDQTGAAPKETKAGSPTVLVLRNGRVLQGSIRADSHGYFVDSRRSTLYFPFSHVKFVAADLREAYAKLCDSVGGSSSRRDMLLGRWCLENDLRAEAAEHFRNVLTFEPANREARQALARLDQAQGETPAEGGETKPAPHAAETQFPESLSRLSGSAVREFVTGVQPILLTRCGSVRCHGTANPSLPSVTTFHLEHVRISQGSNRAATARNLEAVLNQLDGQFPTQSALFQKATQPHGGETMRSPLDGPAGRSQEMRLRRWVEMIAPERSRLKREQASRDFIGRFSRSRNPPTLHDPNVVGAGGTMDNAENGPMQPDRLTPPPDASTGFHNPGDSPKRLGPLSDPFDPSQFNGQNQR
jgi:hypothetical protein